MQSQDRNLVARRNAKQFDIELETLLKRHLPYDYATFASARLWTALEEMNAGNPNKFAQTPPHRVIHSIEANCAYCRRHGYEKVDLNRLFRVMNVYHGYDDPLQFGMLEDCGEGKRDIQNFFLVMWREQMELQFSHSKPELARTWRLFAADDPIPATTQWLREAFGVTPVEWIQLCFAVHTAVFLGKGKPFQKDILLKSELLHGKEQAIVHFLNLSSLTPLEIGERFRKERQGLSPQFHCLIRSVFFERPLIDFGRDGYLCPHPYMAFRHSNLGLYRLARECPTFGDEFGHSFQEYVGQVLRCISGSVRVLEDKELERLAPGKSCDFLVEREDEVILVECKATTSSVRIPLEENLVRDGSTGMVAKALVQLYTTAHDLVSGRFSCLGVGQTKPLVGVVVTFGELPFANSDWYYDKVIFARSENDLSPPIYPSEGLSRRPMVISVSCLEDLALLIRDSRESLVALYDEKQNLPYVQAGDWDVFVGHRRKQGSAPTKPLPFVEDQWKQLLDSFRQMAP
jgi:hypothetical protein